MNCKCKHSRVCELRNGISYSLDKIINTHFGGRNPVWDEVEKIVQNSCKFRLSNDIRGITKAELEHFDDTAILDEEIDNLWDDENDNRDTDFFMKIKTE